MAVTRILAPVFLASKGRVMIIPEMEMSIDHELEMLFSRRESIQHERKEKTWEIIQATFSRCGLSPRAMSQLSFFDPEELY